MASVSAARRASPYATPQPFAVDPAPCAGPMRSAPLGVALTGLGPAQPSVSVRRPDLSRPRDSSFGPVFPHACLLAVDSAPPGADRLRFALTVSSLDSACLSSALSAALSFDSSLRDVRSLTPELEVADVRALALNSKLDDANSLTFDSELPEVGSLTLDLELPEVGFLTLDSTLPDVEVVSRVHTRTGSELSDAKALSYRPTRAGSVLPNAVSLRSVGPIVASLAIRLTSSASRLPDAPTLSTSTGSGPPETVSPVMTAVARSATAGSVLPEAALLALVIAEPVRWPRTNCDLVLATP